ncbi:MAG: hypothetical protein K0R18_119 [Bacillales bacterium]|jgi:hypothetical protein|nr:hypothetical protein [Bacillales bacterium]
MANKFNDSMNKPLHSQRAYGWDRTSNPNVVTGTRMNPATAEQNGLLQTSTNITMKINGDIIGMVQSLSVSESRTINKLQAIGHEGIVQAVPGNTQAGQLSISRIALYDRKFADVVGINDSTIGGVFVTLRNQRVPFEISIETPTTATAYSDVTTYCDCWISSYSKSYGVQSITVAENLTVQYSDVT